MSKHNRTEAAIRAAAIKRFGQRGFEGTGVREIARDVGLTPAALYHCIGSNEELLASIMRDGSKRLYDECRAAMAAAPDSPARRLAALISTHVRVHCEAQLEARVSDQEIRSLMGANRREVIRIRDRYEDLWRQVIAEGVQRDLFSVVDQGVCRLALIQMCTGVANWYDARRSLSTEELSEMFVALGFKLVGLATDGAEVVRLDVEASRTVKRRKKASA